MLVTPLPPSALQTLVPWLVCLHQPAYVQVGITLLLAGGLLQHRCCCRHRVCVQERTDAVDENRTDRVSLYVRGGGRGRGGQIRRTMYMNQLTNTNLLTPVACTEIIRGRLARHQLGELPKIVNTVQKAPTTSERTDHERDPRSTI